MKKRWIAGIFVLLLGLAGCAQVKPLHKELVLELGQNLSTDPAQYVTAADKALYQDMSLDFSEVDFTKAGDYTFWVVNQEKQYPIILHIQDTTAPEAVLKDAYAIVQPNKEIHAADLFEKIEDRAEAKAGFYSKELTGELTVMSDEELEALTESQPEMLTLEDEDGFFETMNFTEEGIYTVRLAARDASGNAVMYELPVYVDGTAPVLTEREDETITINNAEGEFNLDMSEFFSTDNFDGDLSQSDRTEGTLESIEYDEETETEVFQAIIKSADRAGNTSEVQWKVTVRNEFDYDAFIKDMFEQMNQQMLREAAKDPNAHIVKDTGSLIHTEGEVHNQALVEEGLAKIPSNMYQRFVSTGWHIILTDRSLGENVGGSTYWSDHIIMIPDSMGGDIPTVVAHEMGHFLGGSTGTP